MPGNLIKEAILMLHLAKPLQLLILRLRWHFMSEAQRSGHEALALARSQDRVVEKYLQAKQRLN